MTQTQKNQRPQALVTGGTRGIGRAICLDFAKNGFDVAFTYRSAEELAQSLEKELISLGAQKAKGYRIDMADTSTLAQEIGNVLKEFTEIEVLVNNAGISLDGLTLRYKPEDFDKMMATNVKGAFLVTQTLMRPMMKARKGSIIFISSLVGQMGNAGQVAYATTKSALFGMAKSLAKELGSRNVRVNVVAPGFIKTDMTDTLPETTKEQYLKQIPLEVFGEPEDIAQTVTFLASKASRYITGQIIGVNGGMYM